VIFGERMRSVGKQARDESGKYPVNENDEEIFCACAREIYPSPASSNSLYCAEAFRLIATSEAKRSIAQHNG
jgi:hypothetical protein